MRLMNQFWAHQVTEPSLDPNYPPPQQLLSIAIEKFYIHKLGIIRDTPRTQYSFMTSLYKPNTRLAARGN